MQGHAKPLCSCLGVHEPMLPRSLLHSALQERVLQLVRAGHNVFFTGNAGEASLAGDLLGSLLCTASEEGISIPSISVWGGLSKSSGT